MAAQEQLVTVLSGRWVRLAVPQGLIIGEGGNMKFSGLSTIVMNAVSDKLYVQWSIDKLKVTEKLLFRRKPSNQICGC